MSAETASVERALGAIGTTFRLMRLYPPSHPAVAEALRQIGEALPALAALGTVEWKVGVTGLHWHGQHLLPRNAQIAELAGLLYARGVRGVTLNPGITAQHVLALFQVATGTVPVDDGSLGRIALSLGRRTSARLERLRTAMPASDTPAGPEAPTVHEAQAVAAPPAPAQDLAPPASPAPPAPAAPPVPAAPPAPATQEESAAAAADTLMGSKRSSTAFRPDVLPLDVEVKR